MTDRQEGSVASSDSWFRAAFDLIVATGFLSVIGCLFVAFAVLMGKYELLILAYVLMGAACVRSLLPPEKRKNLEKTAVVGEGLKIFNRLESHYLHHKPRSFFFYLLFPITGVWSFFFSKDSGRQELKAYWGLLQWILILLVVGGFGSYYRFYQHFDWKFSLTWLYMELLAVYFLCNFFAVPLSTTSLRLSLEKKRFRLFTTTFVSLIILSSFTYVFAYRSNYENLVPINIMLDERLAQFKARVQQQPVDTTPLHQALLQKDEDKPYFTRMLKATQNFLQQHGKRIQQFNQQYLLSPNQQVRQAFYKQLNARYQERLAAIATMEENKHFFITVTQMPRSFWALVCVPFRESAFYFFRYKNGKLKLYESWAQLTPGQRRRLLRMWDRSAFVFSNDKRMAQVVVEFMRDKFQRAADNLDRLVPRKADQSPKENQSARQDKAGDAPAPSASPAPGSAGRRELSAPTRRAKSRAKRRPRRRYAPRRHRPSRARRRFYRPRRVMPAPPPRAATPSLRPDLNYRRKATPKSLKGQKRSNDSLSMAEPTQKQTLRREINQLNRMFRSFNTYLRNQFGLRAQNTALTPGDQLLALWPKPWHLENDASFQTFLKDTVLVALPRYRQALQRTVQPRVKKPRIRWGQPAAKNGRVQLLKRRIAEYQRKYKSTRSMFFWSKMKRLKQELLQLQRGSTTLSAMPAPRDPRLTALMRQLQQRRQRLRRAFSGLRQQWHTLRLKRKTFSVHSAALVSFDYPRALSAMLLFDHFGKTPELVQTWWTKFYEAFLTFVILLFQLTMPFHILLILFCQVRIAAEESPSEDHSMSHDTALDRKIPDGLSDEPPPSKSQTSQTPHPSS